MLTKKDAKMAQGLAIIGMVALHLFCRIDNLPYYLEIFVFLFIVFAVGMHNKLCMKKNIKLEKE